MRLDSVFAFIVIESYIIAHFLRLVLFEICDFRALKSGQYHFGNPTKYMWIVLEGAVSGLRWIAGELVLDAQ